MYIWGAVVDCAAAPWSLWPGVAIETSFRMSWAAFVTSKRPAISIEAPGVAGRIVNGVDAGVRLKSSLLIFVPSS